MCVCFFVVVVVVIFECLYIHLFSIWLLRELGNSLKDNGTL